MCGLRLLRSYICFSVHSDFVKIKVNPQRAKGIHRAARCIAPKVHRYESNIVPFREILTSLRSSE